MSVSLKVDENNNLVAGVSFFEVRELDCVVQDTRTRLQQTAYENPFNLKDGIDYLFYLQNQDTQGLLQEIKKRILEDKRVLRVDFDTSEKGGTFFIKIETVYGNATLYP